MEYRLLSEFARIFEGREYRHRVSTHGDFVAMNLYEDLVSIGRSTKLPARIKAVERVVNVQNTRRGIRARRGDGTFGEIIPGEQAVSEPGYSVARGPVATVEIGAEVKVLAKAMIKQIDRVISDLQKQVEHFARGAGSPICVGIVGINSARECTSYESDRSYKTDGSGKYRHPYQEAPEAERRLIAEAEPSFDEFLILRYRATNAPPFPFEWVDSRSTKLDYGAILTRVSREYDRRF